PADSSVYSKRYLSLDTNHLPEARTRRATAAQSGLSASTPRAYPAYSPYPVRGFSCPFGATFGRRLYMRPQYLARMCRHPRASDGLLETPKQDRGHNREPWPLHRFGQESHSRVDPNMAATLRSIGTNCLRIRAALAASPPGRSPVPLPKNKDRSRAASL